MTLVTVLPHAEICPAGATFEVSPGKSLRGALSSAGIAIEHACDGVCACSTCHVVIHVGINSLVPAHEDEEDQLDHAWGLTSNSRLACQIKIGQTPITLEIPRYSLNHAREQS